MSGGLLCAVVAVGLPYLVVRATLLIAMEKGYSRYRRRIPCLEMLTPLALCLLLPLWAHAFSWVGDAYGAWGVLTFIAILIMLPGALMVDLSITAAWRERKTDQLKVLVSPPKCPPKEGEDGK